MTKVYFACSIRGGGDKSSYAAIIEIIKTHAELLTEVFVADGLRPEGSPGNAKGIWQRDIDWLKEADAVVAEVTNPSLGVGYEIAKAEEWGKPVLALYRPSPDRKLSAMIAGSPNIHLVEYTDVSDAKAKLIDFINGRA
jgi:nucleoside 2-deoxyribosyltransferase